jgi:predicted nucleic acid-binding protein
MRVYIDSDIMIWHLRGEMRATRLLERLSMTAGTELWTAAMQRAEIVSFVRAGEEQATMSMLAHIRTEPLTQPIVDRAAQLYRRWNPTHGIDVNDALLAATAATSGGTIMTQNLKHYPMPEAHARKGW